ncbi:MAG: hypothetical protein EOP52_10645 [Sphingobacteriales bacterium]|nr:MAG: hypothetical protein EOP52_10645 [Sphingobacteriales bacterium]
MLDQLNTLAQQVVPQALPSGTAPQGISSDVITQEASSSLFSGMQDLLQQGGPGAIKSLFQGAAAQDASNPEVQQVSNHFAQNLSLKTGMGSSIAKTIAMAVIPMLLSKLFQRTKDPGDSSFSITSILGSLLGGGALGGMLGGNSTGGGGLGGMLGGLLGGNDAPDAAAPAQPKKTGGLGGMLDRDGDGDTDLNDLMAMFR